MSNQSDSLTAASFAGDIDAVRSLLQSGVDVNQADSNGVGALLTFHPTMVEYLLSQGANPDLHHNENGTSVLAGLCYVGQMECVKLLLEHGANPNFGRDDTLETPLHHLLANDSAATWIGLLIQHGADVNAKTKLGETSFNFYGQTPTRGETPLHRAAAYASRDVVLALLQAGADPKLTDCNGYLAYHWAGWHMRPKGLVETLNPENAD